MPAWTKKLTNQAELPWTRGLRTSQLAGFHQIRFFSTVATLQSREGWPGPDLTLFLSPILNSINRFGNCEVPAGPAGFQAFRSAPIWPATILPIMAGAETVVFEAWEEFGWSFVGYFSVS